MEHFTVIDLGSNAVRMTITRINDDGSYQTVKQIKRYIRLSEGMDANQELQPEAIDRTLAALADFKDIYETYKNVHVKAVATAATRKATNRNEFLACIQEKLGIRLDVISGLMEAKYDYLAVANTLPVKNYVMLDTGGGSTEIVLCQNGVVSHRASLPIGSVGISHQFHLEDEVSPTDIFDAMSYVNDALGGVWWLKEGLNLPIIAVGGSNRTLAKIYKRSAQIENLNDIHGYRMSRSMVNHIFSQIIGKNQEQRKEVPGLSKVRADIIVGGLIPIILILRFLDSDRVVFSASALRDGVLKEHLNATVEQVQIKE
ncbi:exopolyphosphatase [Paucilactobacillus vaccinostercus DSM 20634]|uniref:Exopolyphosphatase n=1 Tax=Paucilactobacillus vaccinostercus DSM 20634 TaxID=1423813 RepID=A0A0R2A3E0_9LACO|nr:Ppx/GppA family phosphatase [Paucilactobacillus vaccinostercus]KRM61504.1 exopolyphosphatase [Paucilactobacillus vaccinostercus DSM 20634]